MKRPARIALGVTFFTLLAFVPQLAVACPTCKDSITENYVQAYGMSIIFMMSMPFIIFGALSAYFYYEVCKARRQKVSQRAESTSDPILGSAEASPSP